jgi:hypothetical protein
MDDRGTLDTRDMYSARPELEQLTAQMFSFMEVRPGWRKGRTRRNSHTASFYYMHTKEEPQIALWISLGFPDNAIDVYLVKLEGGKLPAGGYQKERTGPF